MSPARRPSEISLGQVALVELCFGALGIGIVIFRHAVNTIIAAAGAIEPLVAMVVSATLGWLLGAALSHSDLRPMVLRATLPFRSITSASWSIVLVSALAGVGEEVCSAQRSSPGSAFGRRRAVSP